MNSKTPPVPVISKWQAFLFVKTTLADGTPRQSVLGLFGGPVNPRGLLTALRCSNAANPFKREASCNRPPLQLVLSGEVSPEVCGVWLFHTDRLRMLRSRVNGQRTGSQAPAPQWTKVP